MMPVPVALEPLLGIVLSLEREELRDPRVASEQLLPRGPTVVREVVTPAPRAGGVDERAERVRRVRDPGGRVLDVQVEDDARPRLARPREEALLVALDEAIVP
jgi:hypothetical protein